VVGGTFAVYHLIMQIVSARDFVFERADEALAYTTSTYLLHGQLPITDFYEPYGVGLGVPGAIAHLLGFGNVFDLRVTYGLFPALATLLAVVFVWRRTDWKLAVLVGLVSLASNIDRYSMGFAPLFGFLLMVDWLSRGTATGALQEIAARRPRALALASAVLSLAGWARVEYEIFGVIWAAVLALVLRGRERVRQSLIAAFLAVLPTILVLATGGATHLWWIVRYLASGSSDGFNAQRGRPIQWDAFTQWLSQLWHLQLGSGDPAQEIGSYGVGLAVVVVGVVMFAVPRLRRRLLRDDPAYLTLFMVVVSAVLLYSLSGHFDATYGATGAVVWWVAGALVIRRIPAAGAIAAALLLGYPLWGGTGPGYWIGQWNARSPIDNAAVAPALHNIPLSADGGGPSMTSLVALWGDLGLQGRPTITVSRRNDVLWSNDTIVGYLLDGPAAAWPMVVDPGVVNRDDVERETVADLCRNRAPVVQTSGVYPYPAGVPPYVGSRRLDEFLAVDYRVRAVAGFYRILVPATPRCVLPQSLSDASLASLRDRWIVRGEMPEAGALAVLLMDRERARGAPVDPADAATAALGGYQLRSDELPTSALGTSLVALASNGSSPALAAVAAIHWPSDVQGLAAQTAWVTHRTPSPYDAKASSAVLAMALRHPNWPQAIQNATAIIPGSGRLFRELAPRAAGMPAFDGWRLNYYMQAHRSGPALSAGLALIADYKAIDDPVNIAQTELAVSSIHGLPPGCALLLRRRASDYRGSGLDPGHGPLPSCGDPRIAGASL
jgi:hypothetical protein